MRVLICGGRDFDNMKAVSREMSKVRDWYGGISCVIQGGARGADYLGKLWAEREGLPVCEFRANWNRYGKRAGPVRNQWMIEHGKPDVVVAFPGGRGTEDMLARAAKAELLIWTPLALAAAASGGDVKQAPGEAPQSGPKGNAQPPSPNQAD